MTAGCAKGTPLYVAHGSYWPRFVGCVVAERALRRHGAHVMDDLPCEKREARQSSTRHDQKPKTSPDFPLKQNPRRTPAGVLLMKRGDFFCRHRS